MQINFYSVSDEPNVVNKTLGSPLSVNINLKRDTDITFPDLILVGDFRRYNYAFIPDLKRYYFIRKMEQLNLTMVKISLECDYLKTYEVELLNSEATYLRDIQNGDYGIVNADSSINKESVTKSDTALIIEQSILISTMEVKKNG